MSKLPVNQPKIFDPSQLDAMTEPLFVRVEKGKSGMRTPIPLPPGEDGLQQGTGWSKDDVRGLEMWLANEWSGGGQYHITVSDSSLPVPLKHSWQSWFATSEYPEKTPPSLAAAAVGGSSPSQPQQVRQMAGFPSAFPNGLPGGGVAPVGQPNTVFVPQPGYYPPQPQPSYYREPPRAEYPQAQAALAAAAAAETERRRYEDQLKEMQAQLARAREEQLQAQHRQELERVEARMRAEALTQNEKFTKLEQLIASLATTVQRPAVDPAIEQLREQNRMLAAQAENERRERESERRDRETRDLIQRQAEESRRQIEAVTAQMQAAQQAAQQQAALAAAASNKPDQMIMFLQENARQQVEAVKEQARNQTTQMAQMQTYMMNPRDVMAMAKESSNGLDQATRSITSTYQSILEMQRNAVEQILQLNQGGGSETIQLIEKGLDRASSFAERFIGGKTKEAVSAQQSQAQLAQANAAAMQAQAQAMTVQAAMQRQQQTAQGSGLNGVSRVAATAGPSGETQVSQTSSAGGPQPAPAGPSARDGWTTGPVPVIVPPPIVKRYLGHTDEEWFGPILPKVIELRTGVARFIESIGIEPPRLNKDGTVDGVEPEQAADVILQAAMIVMQQQIPIPAMINLLGQGRVADFMDVLLPDAPQPFRDEVAQLVVTALQGGNPDDDDDEDEDEEGDENDGNDAKSDEAAAPAAAGPKLVKPAKPAAPRAPARA